MRHTTFIESAIEVIKLEAKTIANLPSQLDDRFESACELIFNCQGHVVVIGVGKSGHIGKKIAATLASTGTSAFFVHAAEANHGDLGMVNSKDIVLALSHSGETDELISILPTLKLLKVPLILLTGNPTSTLAQQATLTIPIIIEKEACPLGLAPTVSSTAALVIGDAIAIALLKARGFSCDDFAKVHPKGHLGRRLLLKVRDLMHKRKAIPQVSAETTIAKALIEMSQKRLGMTTITQNNKLLGVFTDGDLRRTIDQGVDLHHTPIKQVMNQNCKTIEDEMLAVEALRIMEEYKITTLVIVDDEKRIKGIVHLHDILMKGIN